MGSPAATDVGIVGFVSIAGWELLKFLAGHLFKRRSEKSEAKRKIVHEQIASAKSLIERCTEKASRYLAHPLSSEEKRRLGSEIKHDIRILGQMFNDINHVAKELSLPVVGAHFLVDFRRATTWHVDDQAFTPKSEDSYPFSQIYRSSDILNQELIQLQLAAT